jgi:catechol 2,3-dioxygenase-like lactoylglutathione lyase family enzyme
MFTRFDHIAIAVRDLKSASRAFEAAGFTVTMGGRHTGRGTENAIVRFGMDYLELLACFDPQEAMAAGKNGRFLVPYLARREGGLVAYSVATYGIGEDADRLRRAGLDFTGPFRAERIRPDGRRLSWQLMLIDGTAMGKPWPTIIEWDQSDADRLAWEPVETHANGARGVAGVTMIVRDIQAAKRLYEDQLGFAAGAPVQSAALGAGGFRYRLGDFTIDVMSPVEPGIVRDALEDPGEGLFEVQIAVDDLARARARIGLGTDATVIPPERLFGARLALVAR